MTYSRAAYFLAIANENCRPPKQRELMFRAYEREAWYDACIARGFPIIAVPGEHQSGVLYLIHERHIGPLSGFQIKR